MAGNEQIAKDFVALTVNDKKYILDQVLSFPLPQSPVPQPPPPLTTSITTLPTKCQRRKSMRRPTD